MHARFTAGLLLCRYGDWLRSGWRNVLEVVVRLHRLDLLPPSVIAADGENEEEARARLPRPASLKVRRALACALPPIWIKRSTR